MIFQTFHTLKISDFSFMIETENFNRMSKIWMPKKILARKFETVMLQFMESISDNEMNLHYNNERTKLYLSNMVSNTLPLLYIGLMTNPNDEMENDFRAMYGCEPNTIENLKLILDDIDIFSRKLKNYTITNDETKEKFSVEKMLVNIEIVLNIHIDRSLPVSSIHNYYKSAQKKLKPNQNGDN